MAIIGTFTTTDNGYQGTLATLTLKAKLTFTAHEKTGEKSPDFRVYAGTAEVGAAWKGMSKDDKPYLSVKLDDPSFSAPILARLIETEKGFALIWNR
jgi:uncharacterized protein (DUF736 family)